LSAGVESADSGDLQEHSVRVFGNSGGLQEHSVRVLEDSGVESADPVEVLGSPAEAALYEKVYGGITRAAISPEDDDAELALARPRP